MTAPAPEDSAAHMQAVDAAHRYRLLNHGPAVLVSARSRGVAGVMAAAWACMLDFDKLSVVIDKSAATRALLEESGHFAIQVPTAAQAALVHWLGTHSLKDDAQKLAHAGVRLLEPPQGPPGAAPLVAGCAAWLSCRLLPEPRNQSVYDLFIGQITGAWADARIFRRGHWLFESAPPYWRSLHYVAGGHFYATGEAVDVPEAAQPGHPA